MERERSAAAAMLGLPGFVVLAVSDHDGELEQAIETPPTWCRARCAARWPSCTIAARSGCVTCPRVDVR